MWADYLVCVIVYLTSLLKRKGLELIYKNFHPVSGLPFLSKVIEKVVSEQLTQHVTASNLNEQYQSAYRRQHSTETALLKMMNLLMVADNQQLALMAFLIYPEPLILLITACYCRDFNPCLVSVEIHFPGLPHI